MKKTLVAVALAVLFVLSMAVPAFAQTIIHVATYDMDGDIWIQKQVGHLCNTGAEQKQFIRGEGKMTKTMDVTMVKGKITVDDKNDWITSPTAIRNLTVTSVIELCAPPKYTYEGYAVSPTAMYPYGYPQFNQPKQHVWGWAGGVFPGWWNTGWDYTDAAYYDEWEAVSQQIWAVQVEANPGFSGNIHQKYTAAYGPYWGESDGGPFNEDDDWNDGSWNRKNSWRWERDEDGIMVPVGIGVDFVGNYFSIEQMARTSSGVTKRYIDISSPFSGGYVFEDMTVTGFAEIAEAFHMVNLPEGEEVVSEWWELF